LPLIAIILPLFLFSPFRFAFRRHYIRRFHYSLFIFAIILIIFISHAAFFAIFARLSPLRHFISFSFAAIDFHYAAFHFIFHFLSLLLRRFIFTLDFHIFAFTWPLFFAYFHAIDIFIISIFAAFVLLFSR
jgi:hypothetical protein